LAGGQQPEFGGILSAAEAVEPTTFYGWMRKRAAEPAAVENSQSLHGLEPRRLPFVPLNLVERPGSGVRIQLADGAVLAMPVEQECLRLMLPMLVKLETDRYTVKL
jgi:hypothetical protein